MNAIIENADADLNGYIDFGDFLLASIDLSSHSFFDYCAKCYDLWFHKRAGEEVTVQELQDALAAQKFLNGERIVDFLRQIDRDGSGTISYKECF